MMYKAHNLKTDGLRHGFMSREGGVSEGIYTSLNCALGSSDRVEHVVENRRRAVQLAGLGTAPLVTCSQIHSAKVVRVTAPWSPESSPDADALVTKQPSIALGILTADCTPVLFADRSAGVIGAAHAGWKGAVGGVLEATLEAMLKLGATHQNIRAAIGPCIHQASYEVGAEFRASVLGTSVWAESCFQDGAPNHFYFDLPGYVAARLARASLENVERVDIDTYTHADTCFSYRRTTHQGGGDYGRSLSVIGQEA